MDREETWHVALFGVAPSIQELVHGRYQFTTRGLMPGEGEAETFDLELPNTVGHTLLVGRIALRESTTDSWAVYGEREGQTIRPDKITEYVFGGREGVVGHVLWRREAERERQADTPPQLRIWDEEVTLKTGTYAHGGTAVFLETADGEPLATVSTWFPQSTRLPPDVVYVKGWAENEPIIPLLTETGLLAPAPEYEPVESGWVTSRAYRVPSLSAERSAQQEARAAAQAAGASIAEQGCEHDLAGAEWGDATMPPAVRERDAADEFAAEAEVPELDRVPSRYFAQARPRQAGMRESCKEARTPRGYVTRARARQIELD